MSRLLALFALAFALAMPAAAAPTTVADFTEFGCKELDCYQHARVVRSVQLASERERLFVAMEQAKLKDFQDMNEHASYALWGQYLQGWVLLLIGVAIVVVGMMMSWQQMAKGLRDGATLENALEIGKDGLRFKSPVVGLFIFGASLWFFSVYIEKVYTLTVLPGALQQAPATPRAAQPQQGGG